MTKPVSPHIAVQSTMCEWIPSAAQRILVISDEPSTLMGCIEPSFRVTTATMSDCNRIATAGETFPCVLVEGVGAISTRSELETLPEVIADGGLLVASVRNALDAEYLRAVLRSDLPWDPWRREHAGYATMMKRLLDVGLLPHVAAVIGRDSSPLSAQKAEPLLREVGVQPGRARRYLEASHFVLTAKKVVAPASSSTVPISFIACVNDESQLEANLLASPPLAAGNPHQITLLRGEHSIGEAFNRAIADADNDIVVLVQQDIYLPRGWDARFADRFLEARERFKPIGVVGLFGVAFRDQERTSVGRVVDRQKLLDKPVALPAPVDGLDEILLGFPRDTPIRLDPQLGFHLYGTDACLQAAALGCTNVVVDAPLFHNSLGSMRSPAFHAARHVLLEKWPAIRPLHTTMGQLEILVDPPDAPPPVKPEGVAKQSRATKGLLQSNEAVPSASRSPQDGRLPTKRTLGRLGKTVRVLTKRFAQG